MRICALPSCDNSMTGKSKERKFCSPSCSAKGQVRHKRVPKYRNCALEGCDSQFEYLYVTDPKKFCSHSCAATFNNSEFPKRGTNERAACSYPTCIAEVVRPLKYCGRVHMGADRSLRLVLKWLSGEIEVSDLLKEGHPIREYLYSTQNHKCAICGMGREWNGQPLNFILDHIDGDSSDTTPGNVRLLCPNCDFQLPTSKGKNQGRGRAVRRAKRQAAARNSGNPQVSRNS